MPHTYASVADLQNVRVDGGDSTLGTEHESVILGYLEDASRAVEAFCDRSKHGRGSGFGPRIGTNRYNAPDGCVLRLDDDLLAITSVTTIDTFAGGTATLTDETDFFKRRNAENYDTAPYRELEIHPDSSAAWGAARRGNRIEGTWGYQNVTVAAATMGTVTLAGTTATLSAGSVSAGVTLLNGAEHLYVTAGGTALTFTRANNGSTAVAHADATAVTRFVYPSEVLRATLMIAHRRWKAKQAGLTGDFGSIQMPTTAHRDTERSILRNVVGHLKVYG